MYMYIHTYIHTYIYIYALGVLGVVLPMDGGPVDIVGVLSTYITKLPYLIHNHMYVHTVPNLHAPTTNTAHALSPCQKNNVQALLVSAREQSHVCHHCLVPHHSL
jgi:hypothetical protein